jgi:hypothetical protein
LEAANRVGLVSRGPFINLAPIKAGKETIMNKINLKSLCIGLLAGVTLVLSAGAIGGNVLWGPYQIVCGTHTITYIQDGRIQHEQVPICLKIDTRNDTTWRYATYVDYTKGYKMEGFEHIPNKLTRSKLMPGKLGHNETCQKSSER